MLGEDVPKNHPTQLCRLVTSTTSSLHPQNPTWGVTGVIKVSSVKVVSVGPSGSASCGCFGHGIFPALGTWKISEKWRTKKFSIWKNWMAIFFFQRFFHVPTFSEHPKNGRCSMTISNAKKGHWGQFSRFAWWMGTHPPPGTSPEFGRLTVRLSGKAFMQIPISIASTRWGLMHVLNLGKPGKLNKETERQTWIIWIISHVSTLGFYVFYFSHLPLRSMLTVDVRWRWWLESGEVVFTGHTAWVLVPLTTNMESISPTESILYLLTPHQKEEGLG